MPNPFDIFGRWMVYDVETLRSADDVGGWDKAHLMGAGITVVYDSLDEQYHTFYEFQMDECLELLHKADYVVAFNQINFDNKVLSAYGDVTFKNIDLLAILVKKLGHRVKLDQVAEATLGIKKSGSGLESLEWIKRGLYHLVIDYCKKDVEITKRIFEYYVTHGKLHYSSYGKNKTVTFKVS